MRLKVSQLAWPRLGLKLAAAVLIWIHLTAIGPFERLPGGRLAGPIQEQAITDWRFVSSAGRCAVEVRPLYPHSVTVNCWHDDGQLYVGCMRCEGKVWSDYIKRWPDARIMIAGNIYPVRFARVMPSAEAVQSWHARWLALGRSLPVEPVPDHYWLFRVASR